MKGCVADLLLKSCQLLIHIHSVLGVGQPTNDATTVISEPVNWDGPVYESTLVYLPK